MFILKCLQNQSVFQWLRPIVPWQALMQTVPKPVRICKMETSSRRDTRWGKSDFQSGARESKCTQGDKSKGSKAKRNKVSQVQNSAKEVACAVHPDRAKCLLDKRCHKASRTKQTQTIQSESCALCPNEIHSIGFAPKLGVCKRHMRELQAEETVFFKRLARFDQNSKPS